MEKKSKCPNCHSIQFEKDIKYLGDQLFECTNCKEIEYKFNIDLKFVQTAEARNEEEAREKVADSIEDEYGIVVEDSEIKLVK